MDKKTVLVYDSGIGGLTVLYKLLKFYPNFNYLYTSDSKNAPYGKKTNGELFELAYKNILRAKTSYDFDAVVVACNTLSTNILESLKSVFCGLKFYGAYPFVEVAKFQKTLLLGTRATINSIYIKKAKSDLKMLDTFDCSSLVLQIESNLFDLSKIDLEKYFETVQKNYEAVLLGCTHFFYLKNQIAKIFPKSWVFWEKLGINVHESGKLSTFVPDESNFKKITENNFIFEDKKRNFEVYNYLVKNFKKS